VCARASVRLWSVRQRGSWTGPRRFRACVWHGKGTQRACAHERPPPPGAPAARPATPTRQCANTPGRRRRRPFLCHLAAAPPARAPPAPPLPLSPRPRRPPHPRRAASPRWCPTSAARRARPPPATRPPWCVRCTRVWSSHLPCVRTRGRAYGEKSGGVVRATQLLHAPARLCTAAARLALSMRTYTPTMYSHVSVTRAHVSVARTHARADHLLGPLLFPPRVRQGVCDHRCVRVCVCVRVRVCVCVCTCVCVCVCACVLLKCPTVAYVVCALSCCCLAVFVHLVPGLCVVQKPRTPH
jgi:hypothetical protein